MSPAQQSRLRLTDAERALASSSRQAIVRAGISEAYFDRHFGLEKVVNQPGDRRVAWKFSINGHVATVNDVLGYYTLDGKRIDTHSVATTLHGASDIRQTISRRDANQIMRQCIGEFRNATIEYRAAEANTARLVLTAESKSKTAGKRKTEEPEREQRGTPAKPSSAADVIEQEGDEGPPIIVGSVDLQTGKCTKGQLVVAP